MRTDDASDAGQKQLYDHMLEQLSVDPASELHAPDVIARLAGMHDKLGVTQCNALAACMIEKLERELAGGRDLSPAAANMLTLTDPYFTRCDHKLEARRVLARFFVQEEWAKRPFQDMCAVGHGLAALGFAGREAKLVWERFYNTFKHDDRFRTEAFDVALAGLANCGADAFGSLTTAGHFEEWIAERWALYLPGLLEEYRVAEVQSALESFLAAAPAGGAKDLRAIAQEFGLHAVQPSSRGFSEEKPDWTLADRKDQPVVPELARAKDMLDFDKQHSSGLDIGLILEDRSIRVIYGEYPEFPSIGKFQGEVLELVRRLGGAMIKTQPTSRFAELPTDGSSDRRIIYAFPTFRTRSKFNFGYSVFEFGKLRRLGVVFSHNSVIASGKGAIKSIAGLLDAVKDNEGRIYCLSNFAMQEIMREVAGLPHIDLRDEFDKLVKVVQPDDSAKVNQVPAEVGTRNPQSAAFVFDLSGQEDIQKQISKANKQHKVGQKRKFLAGAWVDVVSHDLDIPVGIGLNRYVVPWMLTEDRFAEFRLLAAAWMKNTAFQDDLHRMGVDVNAADAEASETAAAGRRARAKADV